MKKVIAILLAALFALTGAALAESTLLGMENPWTDTTAEDLMEALGLAFGIPEEAEEVAFRMLEEEVGAEMRFTLNGMAFTARLKPAAEFEDISGLYYEWETVSEDITVMGREAWEARATDEDMTVDLCLWFDAAPGLMYSLSTSAEDLDGFDLIAIAEQVFLPMQEDA